MIGNQRAVNCVETLIEFCKQQKGCQNCIFRMSGADRWKCHIDAWELRDVHANIEARRKNGGYL
jgi:hypothetical protein